MQESGQSHGGGALGRTTAVFARPFSLPGLDEVLPAGEYDLEIELSAPPEHLTPDTWKASVQVHLHPRVSHPGLRRTLSVSLAALEMAIDRDTWSSQELERLFLEEMLVDPMIRLVMQADGVSDDELRAFYEDVHRRAAAKPTPRRVPANADLQAAENEGMPTRTE